MVRQLIPLVLLSASVVAAQGTVSVMAGYLSRVDGEVRLDGEEIKPAPADLIHVRDGERMETLAGRVEMMLYPGSYMRIAPHSTVEMVNAGLLSAEVRVVEGAAVIDLDDLIEKGAVIVHVGEGDRVEALGAGVFRVDVPPKGPGRVRTLSGKTAVWLGDSQSVVKKGKEMGLAVGSSATKTSAKPDELDKWQSERHKETAMAERSKKKDEGGLDALDREVLGMSQRRP